MSKKAKTKREKNSKVKSEKAQLMQAKFKAFFAKAGAFFKRYWYWVVAVSAIIVAVCLVFNHLGYFDKDNDVVIRYDGDNIISLTLYQPYYLGITASNGEEVKFSVAEGQEEIVRFDGNIMYPEKEGATIIQAKAGDAEKNIRVEVSLPGLNWTICLGKEYEASGIENFVRFYMKGAGERNISNSDFIKLYSDADGNELIRGEKEGVCTMSYYRTDENGESVNVGNINIEVVKDLKDEDVVIIDDFTVDGEDLQLDYKNVHGSMDSVAIGMEFSINDFEPFGYSGLLQFVAKDNDIVEVRPDGIVYANKAGKTIISILCVDTKTMTADYLNYEIEVEVLSLGLYATKGDEIITSELIGYVDDERIEYLKTTETEITATYAPNGIALESFIINKESGVIEVFAYDINNNPIVRFDIYCVEPEFSQFSGGGQ